MTEIEAYPTAEEIDSADAGLLAIWLGFLDEPRCHEERVLFDRIRERSRR